MKYIKGGKLSEHFANISDKRMNDIEYVDDKTLLELYQDIIEYHHYHVGEGRDFKYSKEDIQNEILKRMKNES
jgi:hypothetical protein